MSDELYDARNAFLLANYPQAISDGMAAKCAGKKPEDVVAFNTDRDALVALSQVGLGQFDAVAGDLRSATHPRLVAVRLWCALQKEAAAAAKAATSAAPAAATGQEQQRLAQELVDHLLVSGGVAPSGALAPVAVLAASALTVARDFNGALRLCALWVAALDAQKDGRHIIDLRAVAADAYLRLNRADLADKEHAAMKAVDDEATTTILVGGIVALRQAAVRPERYDEAVAAFRDVTARCGPSVLVLNLLALAYVGQGKPDLAERALLDAMAKRSGDPETTANMAMVAAQQGKPAEVVARFVSQAKTTAAPWAVQLTAMEQRFRDAASTIVV